MTTESLWKEIQAEERKLVDFKLPNVPSGGLKIVVTTLEDRSRNGMRSITSSIAKILDMIVRAVHKVLRKILQWYLNNVQDLLPAYLPKHDCFVLQLLVLIEADIAWSYNILYINEAHFYLQNVFNTENCTETTKNPKIYQLLPLHSPKMICSASLRHFLPRPVLCRLHYSCGFYFLNCQCKTLLVSIIQLHHFSNSAASVA